jgi:hypothetical protein
MANSFIHFSKLTFIEYYHVPGTGLRAGDEAMNMTDIALTGLQ